MSRGERSCTNKEGKTVVQKDYIQVPWTPEIRSKEVCTYCTYLNIRMAGRADKIGNEFMKYGGMLANDGNVSKLVIEKRVRI